MVSFHQEPYGVTREVEDIYRPQFGRLEMRLTVLFEEMRSFMRKPNPLRGGDGKSRISRCGEMAGLPKRGDPAFFV